MVGLRQAFGTSGDRRGVPSLGARIGAVVSVTGVVAVTVVMASIHVAQSQPVRFGWTWDSRPDVNGPSTIASVQPGLKSDADVAAAAELLSDSAQIGGVEVSLQAIQDLKGSTPFTVTRGRMPTGPDDVMLGRITMHDLGLDLGSVVTLRDNKGAKHSMTVVGEVVLPGTDNNADVGAGAAVTPATFDRLVGDAGSQKLVLTYRSGSDRTTVERRLQKLGLDFPIYARPEAPGLILQLHRMGSLALALVIFLAGLGSVGLLHFLAASVRRRQREFGTLRALGLIRTQVLGAVTWQAVAVSTVGLVIGVPAGIILGRMAWRGAVSRLGMIDDPAVSIWAVAAVVAIVALGTVVLAAGPGWIAARRTPATQLRSE
jgi:hypothetical protein